MARETSATVTRGSKRAEKAKDGDTRVLPISARLLAILKMAKTDPAGNDCVVDYVFGELGQQVENVKRAWATCVLKHTATSPSGRKPGWRLGHVQH